ncbi:hypothetical protein TARUN_1951 [Trichoderma arundinaceum]|uniref:Uncharacterized protein n=1 Tax=Trichoderma arundinaceum TaxID=490622 RepID=A0A395NW38_TRIAR|nr:hypothetical protein TARUN_1951 [Trichoderma arundinaceum]
MPMVAATKRSGPSHPPASGSHPPSGAAKTTAEPTGSATPGRSAAAGRSPAAPCCTPAARLLHPAAPCCIVAAAEALQRCAPPATKGGENL